MSPDDVVAALGMLAGSGYLQVRVADEWSPIVAFTLDEGDPDRVERQVVETSDLLLLLIADEVR